MTSHDRLEAEEMARIQMRARLQQVRHAAAPEIDGGFEMFGRVFGAGLAVAAIVGGACWLWWSGVIR